MAKITLTPGMNKRNFEDATGLRVTYRDKGKTGISFKFNGSYCNNAMEAHNKKDDLLRRFNCCDVRITRKYSYMLGGFYYTVRLVIPLA